MKDYYKATRECIDKYNQVLEEIYHGATELSDDQDEYLTNFCMYLAHALIKDHGGGQLAQEELRKMATIIIDVID